MNEDTRWPSDLCLEQYVLGELSEPDRAAVDKARETDPRVGERLAQIEASNREILSRYRPEFMARSIEGRLDAKPASPSTRRPLVLALPLGLAAAFLLALISVPRLTAGLGLSPASGPEAIRAKGGSPHLVIFRKALGGPERLSPGSVAASHDVLQVAYEAGSAGFGAIVSIDGRGSVTFHLPPGYGGGSAKASKLGIKGTTLLPEAFELDDAPGFERFFLVYSTRAFKLGELATAATALAADPTRAKAGTLSLGPGLKQVSFLVQKRGDQ